MPPSPLIHLCPVFQRRLQKVKQDKHRRLWDNIFHDRAWLNHAADAGLNPALISPCLDVYYSYQHQFKPIYVYISTGDTAGDFTTKMQDLFFQCLMPHSYQDSTREVRLHECGITLDVSDIVTEGIELVPNKVLSQRRHRLRSQYAFLKDDLYAIRRLRSIDIRGLPRVPFERLSDISNTCELYLTDPDEPESYQWAASLSENVEIFDNYAKLSMQSQELLDINPWNSSLYSKIDVQLRE